MNNTRRKEIQEIKEEIEKSLDQLRFLQEQEQEAFDNLPEGIQMSERGCKIEENVNVIESGIDDIENVLIELLEL